MIHMTTYKSPNGSILGGQIEAMHNARTIYSQAFTRKTVDQMDNIVGILMNDESPYYLGLTGVVKKQQTVTFREWYGIV